MGRKERVLAQEPRPLLNPLIFGNYNVAYVSTAKAPKQDRQRAFPAMYEGSTGSILGSLLPCVLPFLQLMPFS